KDLSDDPQDPFAHLGLVRYDWTPKPALSAFKAMTAACLGGACPCSCPDNITFHTQGQVDEFSSRYPGCNSIKGNVVIRGCEITSLQGLSGLDSVGGNLVIRENAWLYDLSGLENLSFVGGELLISFNGKMTDLTQFKHLKEIGGALTFFGNPSLKSLKGLDSLRSVRGSVNVWVNESLKDLSGLDRLDSIHVNLSIGGNANLIDLNGLGNLRFIGKSFAAGDFFGAKNVSLASLNGLEKLNFIGDKLDIFDNPQLSNLSALDHCIFIGGALRIYNNPVLSTCSVQSICDYLLIPSGLISIGLNASGCETLAKVKSACTTPAPDFNSNVTSGCAPLVVQFVNTSSPCFSSEWQITGGVPATSTETNPLVRFDAPGLYSVTLTIRNAAGSKTVTKPGYIMVLPGPVAGFNGVLINKTVSFSNTSVHATSYSWDFGDGQSSIQTNPKHQFPAAGAYTVTLIAQSDCSADTFSQTFTIGGLPTADFTSDKQLVCAGDTVRFFNFSKNAASFKWAFAGIAGNGTSFLVNPHIVYHTPGIFTVILFAYNDFGMVSEIKEQYITVIGKPLALFDVSGGDGLTLTFDNRSQFGENCQWNFGDGTTGTSCDKEFTHTFPAPGVYTVQLTIQNYCGTSTFTQIISAAMPPVASFTASPEEGCSPLAVQFANKSSANTTSLFWQFPGGVPAVSTAHNPLATFKNPGVYTVSLIVGNAGGSDTFKHIVIVNALPKADFTYQKDGATG
ncbi:MAG: PKD domain-containing protein, partial [Thermoanaerobaculia bacterium]|nr:PKD domain-containing protein [Thermoanaerobaculia bacterium]